jgi:outer membrane protein assembly factor BamA
MRTTTRDLNLFRLAAELDATGQSPDGSIDISITLEAEQACRTDDLTVEFVGNHIYDDTALAAQFQFDGPFVTSVEVRDALDRLVAMYHADGNDLAVVRDVMIDVDRPAVVVTVDEGLIARIDVEQNQRTRDWLIRSYLPLQKGDPYSTAKVRNGINNVYATDLFERVTVDLAPADSGAIMKVGVLEKKYSQLRLGWHWHEEYESEGFLQFLDDNVAGIGMEYLIHGQYGEDRQHYFMSLGAHRLFFTYLTAQIEAGYTRIDRRTYNDVDEWDGERKEENWYARFGMGQQVARLGTVSGAILFEELTFTDRATEAKEEIGLRSLVFRSELESFDKVPFPRTGNMYLIELKITGAAFGGESDFTRVFTSLEIYLPLIWRFNYHPKISLGASRTGLPESEKFYVGGSKSLAGYRVNQLSGDKVFLLNQEFRFDLPLNLYFTARWDVGDIYAHTDQIKLENMRSGLGAGMAWNSPIGPFEVAYGRVDHQGRVNDHVYVNVGFIF